MPKHLSSKEMVKLFEKKLKRIQEAKEKEERKAAREENKKKKRRREAEQTTGRGRLPW